MNLNGWKILLLLMHIVLVAHAQEEVVVAYRVDYTMRGLLAGLRDTSTHVSHGYIESKSYENDTLLSEQKRSATRIYVKYKTDTLWMVFEKSLPGAFLVVALFGDSCFINAFPGDILSGGCEPGQMGTIPYYKKTLTLMKKPTFRPGEIILGIFDFVTKPYCDYVQRWPYDENRRYQFQARVHVRVEVPNPED